jgi:phosphomannomutase / phosphoglucomutase
MSYRQKPVNSCVFRAYDIRGIINKDLDEDAYYSLGLAIACRMEQLKRHHVYVGYDGRLSSKGLAHALTQGLLESGIDVTDLGAVATPVMYFAAYTQKSDSGLMVTGSHNPAEYNGLKMVLAGKTLVQQDIDILYDLVSRGIRTHGRGIEDSFDMIPEYTQRMLSDMVLLRPLKVVVDCGNGIAGPVIPDVLTQLGCEVIPIFCDVDGTFPNHHPDPTIEANLVDLKKAVATHGADLGLAFDGDADRLGLITNLGEMIWPDRLMMMYAKEVLSRNPMATIVYDVKCSSHLREVIAAYGGLPIMCPTGHSIVKGFMKEKGALLAGEMSGHLFFKDRWYGFDDALYSACRLLEILSASPLSISEQFQLIPNSVNTAELKIPIQEEEKFSFMTQFIQQAQFPNGNCITIDGLRVEFPKGFGLIRASNTTPCLVARFEAEDEAQLVFIQNAFKEQLLRCNKDLVLPF